MIQMKKITDCYENRWTIMSAIIDIAPNT